MNEATRQRLFGYDQAFASPVTAWICIILAGLLVATPVLIALVRATGRTGDRLHAELVRRYLSWLVLVPLLVAPVLLGAAWTIAGVAILSILCYREFAAATGLAQQKLLHATVYFGIAVVNLAVIDHWYGFFVALFPLTLCVLAAVALLADEPRGYLQRVALAVLAFMLFGCGLSHLGYMANDADYRPIVILTLLATELNDVFAFCVGKTLGRRKLIPNTSPNKTIAGCLGAIMLTSLLVAVICRYLFAGTDLANWTHGLLLGGLISVAGQFGDLMMSAVKRDLGVKDLGTTIPGHGGLLDRFDSILLVAPVVFHYVGYFRGFGLDQTPRILSYPPRPRGVVHRERRIAPRRRGG